MPGSPSLLRRFRSRVWPMPVAGLLLATAVAAQSPAPPPAALRLHGLVEAVQFFNLVAPLGAQGPAHDRPPRAEGHDGQERRPRRRVRSPGAAAGGDRQAGRVEAVRGGHPQEAGGDERCRTPIDDTAIKTAENDLALARLETTKNDVLPRIDAEKNTLALQAAEARLPSLRTSIDAEAQGRRRRARDPASEARPRRARPRSRRWRPPTRCWSRTPIDGLVVPRTIWKKRQRWASPRKATTSGPASRLLDVVSPGAMRVKVKVNQVDVHRLRWACRPASPSTRIRTAAIRGG